MDHQTGNHHDNGRAPERRRTGQAEEDENKHPSLHHFSNIRELEKQHGYFIGNIDVRDTARAHLGDTYITNNYYATAQPQPRMYETLITSLTFDRMDTRVRNVATALPMTCDWLPNHPDFLAWIDDGRMHEHHGFLWLKGKPGSGKSTIMKETLTWAEHARSGQLILSYFFNARSPHPLEKSSLGLYRSLLCQLLDRLPSAHTPFVTRFASKVRKNEVEDWTEIELQNCLIQFIRTLPIPPIIIFIDALDEGDDDDVRQMVKFLERLTQYSTPLNHPLRVCLSSRHYPHISVAMSCSLVIENQSGHDRDIELYIRNQLPTGDTSEMEDLRQTIQDRSAGIFLWVVIVVRILTKVYDQGRDTVTMLRKLATIPPDLHNIFAQVLFRDPDDFDECITLFQWVLFSKRPLIPIELYHAVQHSCSQSGTDRPLVRAPDVATRYLLNCSRGLVELTRTEYPTVQFIHETVRDYLMSGHLLEQGASTLSIPHISEHDFRAEFCNGKLSEICLVYMLQSFNKIRSTGELLSHYPFLYYAAEHWWQHLQSSQSPSTGREVDMALQLLTGDQTNLLLWVRLYDIDRHGSHLSATVHNLPPPLYYAASIGRQELVVGILALGADINARGKYGTALHAASKWGHEKAVQMLLDRGADVNAQGDNHRTAIHAASQWGHEKVVQMLLDRGADVNANGESGTALQLASEWDYERIVQILLDRGADVNAKGEFSTALQLASEGGHEKVVQILLDRGADVNAKGELGTALQQASERGHEKVVQILLKRGAKPNNEL